MSKDEKKPKAKKTETKAKKATKTKSTAKAKTKTTKKPKETKTTEKKVADKKPKEAKPAETKPKETKPAEAKPTETKPTEAKPPVKSKAENTVFVGQKPTMVYVMAIITCFNENKAKEVRICARGRAISKAVDVAELTRNRFLQDLKVKKITTSTEQVIRREGGGEANVSAIEIILA